MMTLFVAVGVVGVAALALTLVFDGVLEFFDVGDGMLSAPAMASFLGAFGFAGALAQYYGLGPTASIAVGTLAGGVIGAGAGAAAKSLMRMPTDATPSAGDYVGRDGVVITAVPSGGVGEVSVSLGGQPVKVSARAADELALPVGTKVVVVMSLSPTLMQVMRKTT
jgi:hypothetical protein